MKYERDTDLINTVFKMESEINRLNTRLDKSLSLMCEVLILMDLPYGDVKIKLKKDLLDKILDLYPNNHQSK